MSTRTNVSSSATLSDFVEVLDGTRKRAPSCSLASSMVAEIPVYQCTEIKRLDQHQRVTLLREWAQLLEKGAGVLILKQAFSPAVVEKVTAAFERLIEQERGQTHGDHFASSGANDRIWNALEKLALLDAEAFVDYYSNPYLAWVAYAWLGPGYQVTSQVNNIRPGGRAQQVHRDYHLGFMSEQQAATYPQHVHRLSPYLTLQGAVAHCDMPLLSGPTKMLPYSQADPYGYLNVHRSEIQQFFEEHCVQAELQLGDALFFNPALFHAAGDNKSNDINRLANLLQISSAFGRAMENVDRLRIGRFIYPALQKLPPAKRPAAVAAALEGYSFPNNLDRDPPLNGLAPASPVQLTIRALAENWQPDRYNTELRACYQRRLTH